MINVFCLGYICNQELTLKMYFTKVGQNGIILFEISLDNTMSLHAILRLDIYNIGLESINIS